MSAPRLREELDRIAGTAPVADVPRETWARAQRARRRDRVAGVAAAAAAVAVVAGLVTWLPGHSAPPVASGGPGARAGVPAHVWSVPERLTTQRSDGSWASDRVETDLAVGRGAVAYATAGGMPVVVGAGDGAYHLLDLPDWAGSQPMLRGEQRGLAVSPDGRQLAYGWAGRATATAPVPSGVRVVDLETGAIRTIAVHGGEGVVVDTIVWSPDSRWLAWTGDQKKSWTASSMGGGTYVAGRIAPHATASQPVPGFSRDSSVALAVADTGEVSVLSSNRLLRWDGRVVERRRLELPQVRDRGAAASPDGRVFAYGGWNTAAATSVDVATGTLVRHRLPSGVYAHGAQLRPLGWIDDDLVVSEASPLDVGGQQSGDGQLVVATRTVSTTSTYRIVGRTEPGVGDTLSVAVDLMTLDRPTVERPEPDWPWSGERLSLTIGLGVAAALSVLSGLRWLWRRRRLSRSAAQRPAR